MIDKLKEIKANKDLYETILVGTGTIVGSFFSYLLQFVLGRRLSVEDYGSFNTLLSLSSLIGVFSVVLGISLVKAVSELYVNGESEKIKALFVRVVKIAMIVGGILFTAVFLSRGLISDTFKINNIGAVSFFSIIMGLGILSGISSSFLQGLQKFKKFSMLAVISNFNRFIFSILFVFIGFGLAGVFGGIVVSAVITFFVGVVLLGIGFGKSQGVDLSSQYKKIISFSLPIAGIYLLNTSLINMDLILVKRFFSPIEAGYYAGTVTLGKIILFGVGAVTTVMFPKIIALYTKKENFYPKLRSLLTILVGLLVVSVGCYSIFPGIVTRLFFGKTFDNSVLYLPAFSIVAALYVLINFFTSFFLAIEKRKAALLLIPGVLSQYVLINLFHSSLFDVIKIDIFVCIMTLTLLLIYFRAQMLNEKKTV